MKICNPEQIKNIDLETIKVQDIRSVDLMDRVGLICSKWLVKEFDNIPFVLVFCGPGNNGGDGLVVAKYLDRLNIPVKIFKDHNKTLSKDSQYHYESIKNKIDCIALKDLDNIPINNDSILIDCLFGTGLNKTIKKPFDTIINWINSKKCKVISIDMPSGIQTISSNNEPILAVKATTTLCLEIPKKNYFIPPNNNFIGKWVRLSIGLDKKSIKKTLSNEYIIDHELAKSIHKKRETNSHKGTHGRSLVVAGSKGMMGAAILTVKACVFSGSGLTTCYIPSIGLNEIQGNIPEAMAIAAEGNFISGELPKIRHQVLAIGPGLGKHESTIDFFKKTINQSDKPLVIDADGINLLSSLKNTEITSETVILTPHLRELERLSNQSLPNRLDAEKAAKKIAESNRWVVVLKGAHTAVFLPNGKTYYNTTGNPGLAKGGSGDVLTGVITALLAQGYEASEAAILGVYIHGKAADIASHKTSMESLSPMDTIVHIGKVFKSFSP